MSDASTGFDSELSIRAVGPTTWSLLAPLVWTGTKGDTYVVPVDFETDFATVPRFLHWLWLPYGAYTRAAVLHDWLLTELAAWHREFQFRGSPSGYLPKPPANSRDVDGIFRRVMKDLGVGWSKRWLGWTAVRWAALFNRRRAYGRGFVRDLPQILGMSLLALPVVLPGAVGVLISLAFVRVITWVRPPVQHLARRRSGRSPKKEI
jgi:hypothetical protein